MKSTIIYTANQSTQDRSLRACARRILEMGNKNTKGRKLSMLSSMKKIYSRLPGRLRLWVVPKVWCGAYVRVYGVVLCSVLCRCTALPGARLFQLVAADVRSDPDHSDSGWHFLHVMLRAYRVYATRTEISTCTAR